MSDEKRHTMTDAEEIREIFSALNESIPNMISGLIGSIYNPEKAASIAQAIGKFYATLRESGIPDDVALKMTERYVSGLDFAKFFESMKEGTISVSTGNDDEGKGFVSVKTKDLDEDEE
ncbi:MAG: hypothetical protein ACP6IT_11230 [Candidatus Thorarchaeota archaeon]